MSVMLSLETEMHQHHQQLHVDMNYQQMLSISGKKKETK